MEAATAAVRAAFKAVAEVDASTVEGIAKLKVQHGLDAEALANRWEALAVNAPQASDETLLRKLRDDLQRSEAKRRSEPAPLHKRAVRRLPGHGRRIDGFTNNPLPQQQQQQQLQLQQAAKKKAAKSYAERSNIGQVAVAYNGELVVPAALEGKASVSVVKGVEPYKYMYATIEQRAEELEAQLQAARDRLVAMHGWEEEDVVPVGTASQEPVLMCGRVCCEAAQGKLNSKSLLLEGLRADSHGARVSLEVDSRLSAYSFFPGQLIAVRGICPQGTVLHATEVFDAMPPPKAVPKAMPTTQGTSLSLMAAAGPFTSSDDLQYDPLEDLLAHVVQDEPHVLLLMGPFVDLEHPAVADGDCTRDVDGTAVPLTFADLRDLVLSRVVAAVEGKRTRVVIVPSTRDAAHHACFPQPPIDVDLKRLGLRDPQQLLLASNPCTLRVNDDVVVGVTTQDVVFDLSRDDVAKIDPTQPVKPKRLVRLASHLVKQASYYPVFPPSCEAQLDLLQREQIAMPVRPDILFLTTKLQHFVHDADSALLVNPGRLTRGRAGGHFAKMSVVAPPREETPAGGSEQAPNEVPQRARVQVVRI